MKRKILILAANPKDTSPLRLDEEVREIDIRLLAEVGNREQGTGNSGQELTQTAPEKYFCKRSILHLSDLHFGTQQDADRSWQPRPQLETV